MADGSIKIEILVDDKPVEVASKSLDKLEDAGHKSGKGLKATENSMDSLADSSAKAGSSVKGASDSIDNLGDSGAKAGKGLKGAEGAIDGISDSSASASSGVKGAADSLDSLSDSGAKAGKGLKGADSAIDGLTDSSAQASSGVKSVSDSLDGVSGKASEAASGMNRAKTESEGLGQGTNKATFGIKELAASLGLLAIASAAFNTLKSSMDSAIARFDTLNAFPKVLEALGVSAEDSERAINNLSEGIDGLPTTLDDISSSAQQMYNSFKDIDETTDTAIALNNALLASGSNAEEAKRGTDQYIKSLQTGKINMDTWNTLQETMGIGLTKLAENFGFVGDSIENDLYNALQDGSISLGDFNDKLIELGTGTGELAKLAKTNSLGIATSLGNLRNAAARGIADIIASFNKLAEDVTGKDIAQNIDGMKAVVNASFKTIGAVIESTTPVVTGFASAVKFVLPVVNALTPALIGLASAYAIHTVVNMATTAIASNTAVMTVATVAKNVYTVATNRMTLAVTLAATRMKLMGIALAAYNQIVGLAIAIQATFTTGMSLASIGAVALSGAIAILSTAIRVLTGPIGWATAAIGLLVGGVVALVNWFNRTSEETEKMKSETEALANSVGELNDSIQSNANAHNESIGSIEANRQKNEELMRTVDELAAKENKSATEKQLLAGYINELNESVDGLNLSYNEQADALNLSSEELEKRIQLMAEQERFTEAMERQVEIIKEQQEVEAKFGEIAEEREKWKDAVADGSETAKVAAEEIAKLQEEEDKLKETSNELSEEYDRTMKIIAEATENGVSISVDALEEWIGKNEELLGSMSDTYNEILDITTNAFSKMSEKSKATAQEMIENLEHNQKMTKEWGENVAELHEWAGENSHEGFIKWLETLGPDSAAELAEISKMTPAELEKFASLMDKGAGVATDSFKTSLGEGMEDVVDIVATTVDNSSKTMREKIEAADFPSIGKSVTEGTSEGIEKGIPDVVGSGEKMAKDLLSGTRDYLGINSPSKEFTTIGESVPEGMTLGITNGTPIAVAAAKKLAMELLKPFDNTPTQFETIGKDAMSGFNRGLVSGEAQVMATARRIASSAAEVMRRELDIHSPSRVFMAIGKFIVEGLAAGIKKFARKSDDAMMEVNESIVAITKDHVKALKKIDEDARADRWKVHVDAIEKEKDLESKAAESIQRIKKTASDKKRKLTDDEVKKIHSIRKDLASKLQKLERDSNDKVESINKKARAEKLKLEEGLAKRQLDAIKQYIADKKSLGELDLVTEAQIWERSLTQFEKGSRERIEAQNAYKNAVQAVSKEIETINKNHLDQIKKINDDLANNEKQLNDEYNKAYSDRVSTIVNFSGLFDEFAASIDKSGKDLLNNLQSQVTGLQEWRSVLDSLWGKIDDQALMEELEAMGPKALGELQALNSLSESELSRYVDLYNQKFSLARDQASHELAGMKEDTEDRINELREAANAELDKVEKEWVAKIEAITDATDNELSTLKQVGKDAGQGLLDGLASMEGALVAKARSIANSVKSAMTSALDIHSPSHWMRDHIGKNMMLGWMAGIDRERSAVLKKAKEAVEWMKPDIPSLNNVARAVSIPDKNAIAMSAIRGGGYGGGNTTTHNSNSTSYNPTFNNYFTRDESSPSEVTRRNKRQSVQQAMEWGFR